MKILLASAFMLPIAGCIEVNIFPVHQPRAAAFVSVTLGVVGVDTLNLEKRANARFVPLKELVVTFSAGADTVRDTLNERSNPRLDVNSVVPQTIVKKYSLFTDREWSVTAITKDANDSVVHVDSTPLPYFEDGDTLEVALNLTSRYSTYQVGLPSIPDSVYDANGEKTSLCLNRLVLKIDGVVVMDSVLAPGACFAAPIAMAYNYVPLGNRNVELVAYGELGENAVGGPLDGDAPLFSGNTSLLATTQGGSSTTMNMTWAGSGTEPGIGPGPGTASILVVIGKVRKVTLNGEAPGNPLD